MPMWGRLVIEWAKKFEPKVQWNPVGEHPLSSLSPTAITSMNAGNVGNRTMARSGGPFNMWATNSSPLTKLPLLAAARVGCITKLPLTFTTVRTFPRSLCSVPSRSYHLPRRWLQSPSSRTGAIVLCRHRTRSHPSSRSREGYLWYPPGSGRIRLRQRPPD